MAPAAEVTAPTGGSRSFFVRVFDRWKKSAHAIGVVQTRFLMFVIYLVMAVPTGAIMRMFRDPLQLRPPERNNWTPIPQEPRSLETARRQF